MSEQVTVPPMAVSTEIDHDLPDGWLAFEIALPKGNVLGLGLFGEFCRRVDNLLDAIIDAQREDGERDLIFYLHEVAILGNRVRVTVRPGTKRRRKKRPGKREVSG